MAEPLTITAAILSALIIVKEAVFQFLGSKSERQIDKLVDGLLEQQRELNSRISDLMDELRSR